MGSVQWNQLLTAMLWVRLAEEQEHVQPARKAKIWRVDPKHNCPYEAKGLCSSSADWAIEGSYTKVARPLYHLCLTLTRQARICSG